MSKLDSNLVKMNTEMEKLRFPIGPWVKPDTADADTIANWVKTIAAFPSELSARIAKMSPEMLDQAYRPDGWTGRQVIHHCADSHMNALIRFKLALTEDQPQIRPYMQHLWAELADYKADIGQSTAIIDAVHAKWAFLMEKMTARDWQRTYVHPEYGKIFPLFAVASNYAWHGQHHLAHLDLILSS